MRVSGDPPGADELDDQLGQVLAAELVAARVDDLHEPLLAAQVLDAPAFAPNTEPPGSGCRSRAPQSVQTTPSKP